MPRRVYGGACCLMKMKAHLVHVCCLAFSLRSPYILKLYDVIESSQHIFIVMERVKGGELFDYILQKGRLPRQEALRLMAQIIQGKNIIVLTN